MHRIAYVGLVAAFTLAACGGDVSGDGTSGIRGLALVGPQCPVVTAESPCPDEPFHGTIQVLDASGAVVADGRTGDDGSFEIALEPGTYVVTAELEAGSPPFVKPVDVTVEAGTFAEVNVTIDTGIR
jgi:hypothetical protein